MLKCVKCSAIWEKIQSTMRGIVGEEVVQVGNTDIQIKNVKEVNFDMSGDFQGM